MFVLNTDRGGEQLLTHRADPKNVMTLSTRLSMLIDFVRVARSALASSTFGEATSVTHMFSSANQSDPGESQLHTHTSTQPIRRH